MVAKLGFSHFLKFSSLVFLEITYNDSLQQCITSSRGKTQEKNFGGLNSGQNGSKSGPKLVFFLPFSQFGSLITFKLYRMIAWNNV